jgi:hypothetical protein
MDTPDQRHRPLEQPVALDAARRDEVERDVASALIERPVEMAQHAIHAQPRRAFVGRGCR